MRWLRIALAAVLLAAALVTIAPARKAEASHCQFNPCHGYLYPNPNYYYAGTGFDGVIRCVKASASLTSYWSENSTGDREPYASTNRFQMWASLRVEAKQGPYCAYDEYVPLNFFSVNATLWRWNDGWQYPQFCGSSGWKSGPQGYNGQYFAPETLGTSYLRADKPPYPGRVYLPYWIPPECQGSGGRFQLQAEFYVASNYGYRYASLWTVPEVRGG
jgi:hypothetical protein